MTEWEEPSKLKVGSMGKVRLTQESKGTERVWYEVVEVLGDFKFKVKLLNQPVLVDLEWGDIIEITEDDPVVVPEYKVIK